MHTQFIREISVDPACSVAATGSDDKTVRLWSLPEGRPLRVLYLPSGAGSAGNVNATAISPDARYVAVGGWDARFEVDKRVSVTIFDTTSGTVLARMGRYNSILTHLAYSADGRWLAATMVKGSDRGVRIFDATTRREIASDNAYNSDSYGAVFGPDATLYTASYDGKIRKYGRASGFKKEGEIVARGGKQPQGISLDPTGSLLVVGFYDTTGIDLYDASSLKLVGRADTNGLADGHLGIVSWNSDGSAFVAGGNVSVAGNKILAIFDRAGHRQGQLLALARIVISDAKPCGDGYAVATFDPTFGLLDAVGSKRLWRTGVTADMRRKLGSAFTISADAKRVRFGLEPGAAKPVTFDLTRTSLEDSDEAPAGLMSPKTTGLPITDWEDDRKPLLARKPIKLDEFESTRSLAVRPNNDGFVLGGDYWLRAFNAYGRKLWERDAHIAWGTNLSADGRIIVVAYGDGTIRWHRWSDGRELLTLFVNTQTKAWVAWTPTGYYAASPGAEDMIGWHVNRGWDQAADFFPASKFHDQFARPDIVEKILDTLDEDEAVRQADAARGGKKPVAAPVIEQLPPVVSILSPAEGSSVGDDVRLDYLVRSPSGLPVDAVQALVNGNPISSGRGLGRVDEAGDLKQCLTQTHGQGRNDGGLQGCRGALTVSLPAGASEIGLYARAGSKTSETVRVKLVRASAPRGAELLKPKLYALVVGISAYANPDYVLTYPSKDARDFAAALQNQKGGLYGEVEIRALTDKEATSIAIRDGLDWLTKQVTSRDVGIVYLAGHGVLDERERFYFLAADSDGARLRSTAVPREDIADALDALPGKALLFLDACHSGAVVGTSARRGTVDVNTVVNDFARSERGVVVFAGSTGRQVSQENAAWNNGAFTKAVVEGLGLPGTKGKADFAGAGPITTSELDAYVTNRVKDLTGGAQSPVMIRPPTVPDFPLAMAR